MTISIACSRFAKRGRDSFQSRLFLLIRNRNLFYCWLSSSVMLRIRLGDAEVTGVDDMAINDDGLIISMSVHWRPLDQIVAIQQKLAPLIDLPPLRS